MDQLRPIRRQVVVPAAAEVAFDVFTNEIGRWWPVGEFSVHGDGADVGFRDGRVVERGPDGAEVLWGTVLEWQRPHRLRLTWHPGAGADQASEVEVSFAPVVEGQTLVTVEHRGWERLPDPAAARKEYDQGWPQVLEAYARQLPAADAAGTSGEGPVWLALMHTRGPAVAAAGSVFEHPDFGEHVAFLHRLRDRGVLVAAGPLDGSGNGMTVVRVPDPADVAEVTRLAQEDDQSVVRGLLLVRVRPWRVVLTG
jgi:uncharacterized protein YndB with AHSA1/START domain/uncharacterized protein YciI